MTPTPEHVMLRLRMLAVLVLGAAMIGCSGGPKYVPVSGIVTLNGVPYSKAVVSFQPMATEGNPNPGRGSSAYTDENGRFVLMCVDGQNGAVVGKHLVRIMTRGNEVVGQNLEETGSPDGSPPGKRVVDPIPPEWNAASKVVFDVPSGGTDQANFEIKTKQP